MVKLERDLKGLQRSVESRQRLGELILLQLCAACWPARRSTSSSSRDEVLDVSLLEQFILPPGADQALSLPLCRYTGSDTLDEPVTETIVGRLSHSVSSAFVSLKANLPSLG